MYYNAMASNEYFLSLSLGEELGFVLRGMVRRKTP